MGKSRSVRHEVRTITDIVEHIVLVDAATPDPHHILVSVLQQLQPRTISLRCNPGDMPFTTTRETHSNRTQAHLVTNESAGIQFEPPQKVRMLFISKSQVRPGWPINLSSTTRTRRNPIFWVWVSNNWLCYHNELSV